MRTLQTATLLLAGVVCYSQAQRVQPTAMKVYTDPQTGVRVRYPAVWNADSGAAYGADPLTEYTTIRPNPPKPRLFVGWTSLSDGDTEEEWRGETVSFSYAVLEAKTPLACRHFFDDWESEGKPEDVVVHGVRFHHVSSSDAGLGHSWAFELYTTFREGRCLGFSVGSNASRVDEAPSAREKDSSVPMDADAVWKSLEFVPIQRR